MIVETLTNLAASPLAVELAKTTATLAEIAEAERKLDAAIADEYARLARIDARLKELS